VMPGFLATQRWAAPAGPPQPAPPAARGAGIAGATLADWVEPPALDRWLVGIFEVKSGAQAGQYFVPLAIALEDTEEARYRRLQSAALARVRQHSATGVLADAAADEDFCRAVVGAIGASREVPTRQGRIRCTPTAAFTPGQTTQPGELPITPAGPQGANTTVRIGDAYFLKICRRLHPGVSPGVEIGRYLTEVAHFPHSAPLLGYIEYHGADGTPYTLALLHSFITNQGDGWDFTVNYLVRFLEERVTQVPLPQDAHGLYLSLVKTLATRTAQLHAVLAQATSQPELAPEPISARDVAAWQRAARSAFAAALKVLTDRAQLPQSITAEAERVLSRRATLLRSIGTTPGSGPRGLKIRCHGDYHLRQVLFKRNDFVITDFESSPDAGAALKRRKSSPLTDVASMLRSFAYARRAGLEQCSLIPAEDRSRWDPQLEEWEQQTRSAFLSTYDEIARASGLYSSFAHAAPLLRLFELQAACADLRRELLGRPEWAVVPLRVLARLPA
jgi:maltose alpha-D-glucosyltransferase / alpha-amylase